MASAAERQRRARQRRRADLVPVRVEVRREFIGWLVNAGLLDPENMENDAAIATAVSDLLADLEENPSADPSHRDGGGTADW